MLLLNGFEALVGEVVDELDRQDPLPAAAGYRPLNTGNFPDLP